MISGLVGVFEKGKIKQILWALQKSRENPNERLFQPIQQLLNHTNGMIRAEALRNLYFYRQKSIVETVNSMISDPEQEVKIAAFEYLLEHNPENRIDLMNQYLSDSDYKVSGAALLCLAGELRDNPELKKQYELRQVVAEKIEKLKLQTNPEILNFNIKVLLETIGKGNMPGFFSFIENGLNQSDPQIINEAIKAAGLSMAPEFIDKLFAYISNPVHAESAIQALSDYGVEILTFAHEILNDSDKIEIHRKIPAVAENIESQLSVNFLFELLDSEDFQVRSEALSSLIRLKAKFQFLHFDKKLVIRRILNETRLIQDTLSILYLQSKLEKETSADETDLSDARKSLIDLLERRLDGGLERVFRLLGLKYPAEEINSAYVSFQSNKSDIRISSIEFLDNLLDTRLKRMLIPIFETAILETISEDAVKNLNLHIPDEIECYTMLLEGNDIKIKLAVLYLISKIERIEFIPLVEKYRNNPNKKVKDFAKIALTALRSISG